MSNNVNVRWLGEPTGLTKSGVETLMLNSPDATFVLQIQGQGEVYIPGPVWNKMMETLRDSL